MSIAGLTTDNSCCLIIDVQERIINEMYQPENLLNGCRFIGNIARELNLPAMVTEHVSRVFGATSDLVLKTLAPDTPIIQKSRFSACIDPVCSWLEKHTARPNVIVCGIEAHICVLQTSLDLLKSGYCVWLVNDAVSAGEPEQIAPAIRRLENTGAITTGCVSLAYEMMRDGNHEKFKSCLKYVKELRSKND